MRHPLTAHLIASHLSTLVPDEERLLLMEQFSSHRFESKQQKLIEICRPKRANVGSEWPKRHLEQHNQEFLQVNTSHLFPRK